MREMKMATKYRWAMSTRPLLKEQYGRIKASLTTRVKRGGESWDDAKKMFVSVENDFNNYEAKLYDPKGRIEHRCSSAEAKSQKFARTFGAKHFEWWKREQAWRVRECETDNNCRWRQVFTFGTRKRHRTYLKRRQRILRCVSNCGSMMTNGHDFQLHTLPGPDMVCSLQEECVLTLHCEERTRSVLSRRSHDALWVGLCDACYVSHFPS